MCLSSAPNRYTEPDVPSITVTVIYSAKPRQVTEKVLQLEEGSTISHALLACRQDTQFSEIASRSDNDAGVWGKKMPLSHVLRDLDRVEVYRPLTVDPKVARRERFVDQGAKKAAGLFAKRRQGAKAGY